MISSALCSPHLPIVQPQDDMRNRRYIVTLKKSKRTLVIVNGGFGEMIHVADSVVVADNIHHGTIKTNFCQSCHSFLVGNARMDADRQTQFAPYTNQVRNMLEERHTSFFIAAAGDQHTRRTLARQFVA